MNSFFETLKNIWKIEELKNRIFITLFFLAIYRLGAQVVLPGIDSVQLAELPFSIPFYGDHISLLPILASIAIFFYTKMSSGAQMQTSQPGMPNMKFIMYLMPVMMLFFFNNYASGLSLYYFISNVLTIILMLIIKNFIIDDNKILTEIEENKKKPVKVGGFRAKLQKALEEAEKQKKSRGK
jgi:YidC/Oxa1 family membrane protein insertase